MRILIVEDEEVSQLVLEGLLETYGAISLAADGKDALLKVFESLKDNKPYELIMMDINMPRENGVECLKMIRMFEELKGLSFEDSSRIIMTTSFTDSKTILSAYREQCEAYIVKPVTEDSLVKEMTRLKLINLTQRCQNE